jgi:hypothetical protein
MNKCKTTFLALLLALCLSTLLATCRPPSKKYPVGIKFKEETLVRKGYFGDNWCQTWAADDNIYTMLDDGNGWWGTQQGKRTEEWSGSMCLQIKGDADFGKGGVRRMPGWPDNPAPITLYAYGIVSIDGVLYVWLWDSEADRWYGRPYANRLLYSPDLGQTFYRWNGQEETAVTIGDRTKESFFFYREDPTPKESKDAYAFNWIEFCQNGRDNSEAKDDYIYMYSPEQRDVRNLSVIRVRKHDILSKTNYEYFKEWQGKRAVWTSDMRERGVNLRYPESRSDGEWNWASWFPSVVYNKGLGLYLMVSYGITDPTRGFWDNWCRHCPYPASVGFWYAETPYGPWTQFSYTEYFYADRRENRTYGFKLNPKWISKDGKAMQLIWSDAGDDHTTNYKWNQMEIEIVTE